MPRSTASTSESTTPVSTAFARSRELVRAVDVHPSPAKPIPGGDVARWLLGEGRLLERLAPMFDQLCWRLVGAGMALCRATLNLETLHPQIQGVMFRWWRDRGVTEEISYAHGMDRSEAYLASPLYRVAEQGETVRRRIDVGLGERGGVYEFPIFADLANIGATDYLAGPMMMSDGQRFPASWATDAPGGFSERDIEQLGNLIPALAAVVEAKATRRMATDLLGTYLGPHVGQRVLSGQVRRGQGQRMFAVIWYSDLRQSTALADRLQGEEFFELLNDYFDCAAGAVLESGGEVLRFVGDAVLAVFEIVEPEESIKGACNRAYHAARTALASKTQIDRVRAARGEPTIEFGIGLHYGEVMYGNIGVPTRLEFSVIGSAANEVSRIEDLCKPLRQPLLVSKRFAQEVEAPWISMGTHDLRGVSQLVEVFALAAEDDATAGGGGI
jgi:adenylate cyclase